MTGKGKEGRHAKESREGGGGIGPDRGVKDEKQRGRDSCREIAQRTTSEARE